MKTILAIAKDSLREMSKRKLILAIIIAAILTAFLFVVSIGIVDIIARKMVSGSTGGQGSPEAVKMITSQGYNALVTVFSIIIELIGTFLALLAFSTFLPTEIDRGTIKFIISKPVSRMELALGKFLGGTIVILVYSVLMGIIQIVASIYLLGEIDAQEMYLSFLPLFKYLMIGSVAMTLSVIVRPVLAAVIAFFLSGDILLWVPMMVSSKIITYPVILFYYILPTYSIFESRTLKNLIFSIPPMTASDLIYKILYAMDFIAIMLIITIFLFNRKDLI